MLAARLSAKTIDLSQLNGLHSVDQLPSSRWKKRNYFSTPSPTPMTYRDLRSVMSDSPQSKIVLLPRRSSKSSSSSSDPSDSSSSRKLRRRPHSQWQRKQSSFNVYRTLYRSESPSLIISQLNTSSEDLFVLSSAHATDNQSSLPSTGFFHPQNLPNLTRHRQNRQQQTSAAKRVESSKTLSGDISSTVLQIQPTDYLGSVVSERTESTETIEAEITEQDPDEMIITQTNSLITSNIPAKHMRKELHVYMPQICFC